MKYTLSLLAALVALATLALHAQAAAPASSATIPAQREFCATLLRLNEVKNDGTPAFASGGASGSAHLLFTPTTRTLSYTIEATGIPSATLTHIHTGTVGLNGPVALDLLRGRSFAPGNALTGAVTLAPSQVDELYGAGYYVNVHTVAAPAGELRGQVFPCETTRVFKTPLLGSNERPAPVASSGSGLATIWLDDARTRFDYQLTITGIQSATMAHIHAGPITGTGGVVFNLLGSKQLDPATPLTGTLALTQSIATAPITATTDILAALFGGGTYVNVHTPANPAGELRGQLGPTTTRLAATLSGASEVPPNASQATGSAGMKFSPDSGQLDFSVTVSGITTTVVAAHIHEGAPGVNGPIIVALLPQGETRPGSTTFSGTTYLTSTEAISKALQDLYYVNVHSPAFPGGEIRGQLTVQQQVLTYRANLSPANEVPPVPSSSSGSALMTFDSASGELAYSLSVSAITSTVVQAHIHAAPLGVNGPIIFDLLGSKTLAADTPISGTLQLSDVAFDTLNSGGYYVNVHSQAFRSGEMRGQLAPAATITQFVPALFGPSQSPGSPVRQIVRAGAAASRLALAATSPEAGAALFVCGAAGTVAQHVAAD